MEEIDGLVAKEVGVVINKYLSNQIEPIPQDHSQATFVGRRNLEDCRIDWQWIADYTERFIHALVSPYPRPFFELKGVRYEIVRATVVHRYYREIPGHVVYRDEESVWVKLQDGLLRLYELESDGVKHRALDVFPTVGYRMRGNR
jgi:methionyl-tRNA formyltransferase